MITTLLVAVLAVQGQGTQPAQPPPTARLQAPIDLTGYWVSVVTEDWRWRMLTPPKGDYSSLPLNDEGRKVADGWDPGKDEASGNACKSYGGAAIMRVPGRLHITWQDDVTLKIETDAGMQTRLLHFGAAQPPAGDAGWQGYSVAIWELPGGAGRRSEGGEGTAAKAEPKFGNLKAVTTHMRPGYLRKNGVPYSADTKLTEYWDLYKDRSGDWLVITTLVDDPKYLQLQFVTSSNFKRERDGSKWDPTPCSARW